MLALQIDNPEIELIFATKFHGNKDEFIAFIKNSLQKLENSNNDALKFKKLDPQKNSYFMKTDEENHHLSNPFENIEDTLSFSKSLREHSYR